VRRFFELGLVVCAALVVGFLFVPLVALFLRVSPGTLFAQLGSEVALDALWITVKTGLIAHAFVLAIGTPAAYLLGTRRFRGREAVLTAIELPLVLPPAVAGIALFAAFGRRGLLGDELSALGLEIPFTQIAVVMAVTFVALPFYVRLAVATFASLDRTLLDASRTLGAGPLKTFARVALPLSGAGLGAASTLAWARGTGEFGATIMFAGSFQGVTQTLPLAIYAQLDQDRTVAIAIGALLLLLSAVVLLAVKLLPSWQRSTFDSPIPYATSGST
jgi:molybdate transport system permease protein